MSIQLMRKNTSARFVILTFILNFILWLPLTAETPLPDEIRKGFEAIDGKKMKAMLTFVAADELQGRDTGDRGLKIAAKFLESQYLLAGLTPAPGQESMLQKIPVIKSTLDTTTSMTLASGDDKESSQQFWVYRDFLATSKHPESLQVQAPLVFAGFGYANPAMKYDDFKNVDIRDRVLLVLDGTPKDQDLQKLNLIDRLRKLRAQRDKKAEFAQKAGAAAVLFISQDLNLEESRLQRWLGRPNFRLEEDPQELPQLVLTEQAANLILQHHNLTADSLRQKIRADFQPVSFLLQEITVQIDLKIHAENITTQNVVAYLEGSDAKLKTEAVVFGAHYDHIGVGENGDIYNGADDDGSGTVAVLEIARAFAQNSVRPRRSLLFVSHAGEEKGLVGSRYYTNHPLIALENTAAQLNMDMIGRNDTNSIYIIGSNFLSNELHQVNEAANDEIGLELDYTYNTLSDPQRFYFRSDHYNYAKHGIPIIFYFSGTHEDYHKPTDTIEKINFVKMEKVARLVYLTGWQVANLDHRLQRNGIMKFVE